MDDDTRLKFIFYLIIILLAIAIIGIWEFFLEPLFSFLINNVNIIQ